MTLTATFELTPRNSYYDGGSNNYAGMYIYGTYFQPQWNPGQIKSFEGQYTEDQLYFYDSCSADPTLDYTQWSNRKLAPRIIFYYDLSALGERKELALVFGFAALTESRTLIYSDAGLLGEEQLFPGDNQFLMEVETLGPITLYFIHACFDSLNNGGRWFFKGISGYVV